MAKKRRNSQRSSSDPSSFDGSAVGREEEEVRQALSKKPRTLSKLAKKLVKKGLWEDKKAAKAFVTSLIEQGSVKRDVEGKLSVAAVASTTTITAVKGTLPQHKYIMAPMVGASELPFRLLCRKYGAQLCYTPMISSARFCVDEEREYRAEQFQTNEEDRPLVAHFSANNPDETAKSAKLVESRCDAIDLNLGCPQRVAYVGHYGSYLLGDEDRELVLSIVKKTSEAVSIPVFVKIRLLDTLGDTIKLVTQLKEAGAALVAIHARYRASFERTGAGARDGAAMLDQVKEIKKLFPDFPIISNGNIIDWGDCAKNLEFTGADGVMSAEGILNDPALFVEALGEKGLADEELHELREYSADKVNLALEYLDLVKTHPATVRTVVFHTRRMLKKELEQFQLMQDCISCGSVEEVEEIVKRVRTYRENPDQFTFDAAKAKAEKEKLQRKKEEEGKRKRYEERMMRKAKREGKDLNHYLNIGAELPTRFTVDTLKELGAQEGGKEKQKTVWNASHGQHCMAYHLWEGGCKRGRGCAFLHVDIGGANRFEEKEEVAG